MLVKIDDWYIEAATIESISTYNGKTCINHSIYNILESIDEVAKKVNTAKLLSYQQKSHEQITQIQESSSSFMPFVVGMTVGASLS